MDWQKERLEIKAKSGSCKECYLDPICGGVWEEYIYHYGEEEFVPVRSMMSFMKAASKLQIKQRFLKSMIRGNVANDSRVD